MTPQDACEHVTLVPSEQVMQYWQGKQLYHICVACHAERMARLHAERQSNETSAVHNRIQVYGNMVSIRANCGHLIHGDLFTYRQGGELKSECPACHAERQRTAACAGERLSAMAEMLEGTFNGA